MQNAFIIRGHSQLLHSNALTCVASVYNAFFLKPFYFIHCFEVCYAFDANSMTVKET